MEKKSSNSFPGENHADLTIFWEMESDSMSDEVIEDATDMGDVDYEDDAEIGMDDPFAKIDSKRLQKKAAVGVKASQAPIGPGVYTVKQGDCLSSIAYRAGFLPDTIWNDEENNRLRQQRADYNLLLPGDRVHVSEKREKLEFAVSDKCHSFRRKGVPETIEICLRQCGVSFSGVDYVFKIGGRLETGKSDSEGSIKVHIFPMDADGQLCIKTEDSVEEYTVYLGNIDPMDRPEDQPSGIQERLMNLGYACEVTGTIDRQTKDALTEFQRDQHIEITGEPDSKTIDELLKAHGV